MPSIPVVENRERFDVAIAGAGLAGASLAILLARAGAQVALLDPSRFPRDKLCGEYLSPEGAAALDGFGLAREVSLAGGCPVTRVRLTTPRGRILDAEVVGDDDRPGLALGRSTLDALLVASCREAGVTVMEESRVGGAIVEDGRVVGLRARHPSRGAFEVRAEIAVAADGRHSSLVRQTGTTRERSLARPGLFGLKRHFRCDDPEASEPDGTVGLHLVPGGYVGTCRVEGGIVNLCGLLPDRLLKHHRGDLDRLADAHLAANPVLARFLGACEPVAPWKAVSGVRVEVSSPRIPGILYAGDCQGTVDPLGGQGMTMALLGAEASARTILDALTAGGLNADRQGAHQRAWRRRFDGRIRLCRAFHHVLVNPWIIDAAALSQAWAPRFLAYSYRKTRDREPSLPGVSE